MKPSIVGISPIAAATAERYIKTHNEKNVQIHHLKIVCICLFLLTCFSWLHSVMMFYKNTIILEQNGVLIQENYQLKGFQYWMVELNKTYPTRNNFVNRPTPELKSFARIIDARDCPPCTTEKPSIVEPHKNPISILNELTSNAKYETVHTCLNPPIHSTQLVVKEEHMNGKTFNGKGSSKQSSKQVAAYKAIEYGYPVYLDEIADTAMPDLGYNPICEKPHNAKNI